MDDYYCKAYPNIYSTDYTTEITPSLNCNYFNIEFEYTNMYVLNARKFQTFCDTDVHTFSNVSIDNKIMQESTIIPWLSKINVPQDAFRLVVANILECANDMVRSSRKNKNLRVFSIRVDFVVTRASEDESDEDYDYKNEDEEDEESVFEDEMEVEEEENNGLVPAARSCIEELEMVKVEEVGKCPICFEDFNVCVRMPCLHMFHMNCIRDWLEVGNSCPLCRFKMPTNKIE
uniref:RING-type E3 ubiquitin transferase n=1 Tax=Cicer arietinum TaxID=3827 RepID=A0A1S2Z5N0_CICAR|nr:E3 ubiquitin-protein ligase TTC3-like [Cicer arietinum]